MRRKPGRGRVLLLVFLALSVIVITVDFRSGSGGILRQAKDWSVAVVAPVQRGFAAVFRPVGNFFSAVGELGDLRSENRELKAENQEMRAENERADEIAAEGERLRELLELQESWTTMKSVAARIYSPDPGNYGNAVFIDKGRSDGLRPNMPVIAPEGLVGRTLRVTSSDAVVLLLADPNAGAGARIDTVRDTGTVRGNGIAKPLSMELVGKNSDVEVGDEVSTSGLDRLFPETIPIGEVTRATVEGGATSKTIDVEPFVDPQKLDFVLILMTQPDARGIGRNQ
jgi:rod shape-determining protein MreC